MSFVTLDTGPRGLRAAPTVTDEARAPLNEHAEEMVGLVRYERALEASARTLTAANEALDMIVDRLAMMMLVIAESTVQEAVAAMRQVQDLMVRATCSVTPHEREVLAVELAQLRDSLLVASSRSDDTPMSTMIDDLVDALANDDTTAISAELQRINASVPGILHHLARIGSGSNRVQRVRTRTESSLQTETGELGEVQHAECEDALMDLQVGEIAYEATLQTLGRSLPRSLHSFLA